MKIHEVLIYTYGGIEIASYPKDRKLQLVSAFLTANRQFAICNGFTDIQQIVEMKLKFSFLHSSQRELTIVIITDRADPTSSVMGLLRHVRDEFLVALPEGVDFNRYDEDAHGLPGLVKKIVDDAMTTNNARKGRKKIQIVP